MQRPRDSAVIPQRGNGTPSESKSAVLGLERFPAGDETSLSNGSPCPLSSTQHIYIYIYNLFIIYFWFSEKVMSI